MPAVPTSPDIFTRLKNFSLAQLLRRWYTQRDKPFWNALAAAFLVLNIIFLFHGSQYLFGDHDWKYIKHGVPLASGLFEGRFSQFLAINMLSAGEILPLVNNALGFFGYSLGIVLLARYWRLPHNTRAYVFFALFAAVTPYVLSFMYFAFLIIPALSWSAFVIAALLLSAKETTFSAKRTSAAILLFTLALGGYPPVINLFATAFSARLLIASLEESQTSLPRLLHTYRWSVLNFILALIVYKLLLMCFTRAGAINPNYYNLQTIPLGEWGAKALLTLGNLFKQFAVTLPFITAPYKIAATLLTLTALCAVLHRAPKHAFPAALMFVGVFLGGLLTFFISTSLKETEFSPRIDFFGFNYAIAAMLALCLKYAARPLKNFSVLLAAFLILFNAHTLFEAQKVWKLGFDSERLLYKRVLKRYETHPLFNPRSRYIMVQSGSPAFRSRYYHTPYARQSDDLLGVSYTPGMNAGVMWNFDAQNEYADTTSYVYTFKPDTEAAAAIQNARPWPAAQSVQVGAYWILVTFTPDFLPAPDRPLRPALPSLSPNASPASKFLMRLSSEKYPHPHFLLAISIGAYYPLAVIKNTAFGL